MVLFAFQFSPPKAHVYRVFDIQKLTPQAGRYRILRRKKNLFEH